MMWIFGINLTRILQGEKGGAEKLTYLNLNYLSL
jgi:hypothetical protein